MSPNSPIVKKIKSLESTISMVLGILVVVVVGILLFNYFKEGPKILKEKLLPEIKKESTEKEEKAKEEEKPLSLPSKYTTKNGDNLWTISLDFYGSGYNWVDINRENKLRNPNLIFVDQELIIPDVPVRREIALSPKGVTGQPITDNTYTVTKGDNLWNISVRAYQDGFRWSQLAEANKLVDPDLIHPGNVLTIPR